MIEQRMKIIACFVAMLLCGTAHAQFIGGSTFGSADSMVYAYSNSNAVSTSIGFGGFPLSPPNLENLVGIVQIVIGNSSECGTISPPATFTLIPNSAAAATGLCQALYYRKFTSADNVGSSYSFSWTGSNQPFDIRLYVVSNVALVDTAASNAAGTSGTSATAAAVTTTVSGDYLMGFFANTLNAGTWTNPSDMGTATANVIPGNTGTFNYTNFTTQSWAYPIGSTGTKNAAFTGGAANWVADLVAFKPLYRILIPGIAQPLATFATCTPSIEGQNQTESNSTVACVLGATATSAGSTHCEIRCNGSSWVQTGL